MNGTRLLPRNLQYSVSDTIYGKEVSSNFAYASIELS